MKVAILLTGFPRTFQAVAKYNKTFYKSLGLDIDFYISTYDFNTHTITYSLENELEEIPYTSTTALEADLKKSYPNSNIKITSQKEFREWEQSNLHIIQRYPSTPQGIGYTVGKLYSLYSNYNQIKNNLSNYDVCIFTKLDQVINTEDISAFKSLLLNLKANSLYTPDLRIRKGYIKVEENFLILTSDSVKLFFDNFESTANSVFDYTGGSIPTRQMLWPMSIPIWCMKSGLDVRSTHLVQVCVLRESIYRGLSFSQIKELEFLHSQLPLEGKIKTLLT